MAFTLLETLFVLRVSLATLLVIGQKFAEGRIEHRQCCVRSADEETDMGTDEGTLFTEGYKVLLTFTGEIDKMTIELKEMNSADRAAVDQGHEVAVPKKAMPD